ncbi:MAG: L-rhamnose mutarotase [Chitinophagaceae bacterium]
MKQYCLTLDLVNDDNLIAEYEAFHKNVSAEIKSSFRNDGILLLEIYRFGNRLFMIMQVTDEFEFEKKAAADAANPVVQDWEKLMWKYQQAVPGSQPGEKWVVMKKMFSWANQ